MNAAEEKHHYPKNGAIEARLFFNLKTNYCRSDKFLFQKMMQSRLNILNSKNDAIETVCSMQ